MKSDNDYWFIHHKQIQKVNLFKQEKIFLNVSTFTAPSSQKNQTPTTNLKQISVHQFNQNRGKIDLQQFQKKLTPQPKNQPLITKYKKIKKLELIIEENRPCLNQYQV